MWFSFKGKPDIHHTSFHVLCKVQLLRLLSPDTQEIVAPHVKPCMPIVSVFHCHDFCYDPRLRTFAVGKLLEIRNRSYQGDASVRVFVTSPLNFIASSFGFVVDWECIAVTESILTSHLSVDEISSLLEEKFECPRFPARTQAV